MSTDNNYNSLESVIASALIDLAKTPADDEKYQSKVDQLTKLYALKHESERMAQSSIEANREYTLANAEFESKATAASLPWYKRVDPNTLVTVAGNLTVAVLVVKYEQIGVIRTEALKFMSKI